MLSYIISWSKSQGEIETKRYRAALSKIFICKPQHIEQTWVLHRGWVGHYGPYSALPITLSMLSRACWMRRLIWQKPTFCWIYSAKSQRLVWQRNPREMTRWTWPLWDSGITVFIRKYHVWILILYWILEPGPDFSLEALVLCAFFQTFLYLYYHFSRCKNVWQMGGYCKA